MAAICPDFKRSGFQISDSIQNSDHFQAKLFLTIQNLDKSDFQIPTVFVYVKSTVMIWILNLFGIPMVELCSDFKWLGIQMDQANLDLFTSNNLG